MPRPAKGPRLYLRKGRTDNRSGRRLPDIYFIRDGSTEISTGCGPDGLHGPDGAESQLAAYIAEKWAPRPTEAASPAAEAERRSDPDRLLIAEVLAYYAKGRAPTLSDPGSTAIRVRTLLAYFGEQVVSDVRRSSCQAYVAHRITQPVKSFKAAKAALDPGAAATDQTGLRYVTEQGARRELEDLSAAIGYWDDEYHLIKRPKVWLPEKPESNRDALTRSQAAALLKASMGYRLVDGRWKRLQDSSRANRAHLRRFILIGLYTGTRPGVIPKLLWHESPVQAWADLDAAVIYRRGKKEKDHKTKRRPLVRIPPRLLAHMRRWKAADETLMAERAKRELTTTSAIIHHGGRPLAGRIRRGYAGCVADAGLDPAITPHWQRHSAATWLMENGADVWEASGYLGMNPKTLIDDYGHHRPDHQAAALKAMGKRGGN